ncbi:MAG: hypothetical protein OEW87_13105, partial [Flavobacteriaceae bacterium]|nr:hypothetical protein [Flavobacteriaceae bacterium]
TREKLKEFKDDIEGMNNEDLLALDLKTKIADLDLSEEEKKLADKLLPGIADKAAAKNLEGSIIGRMMDQMRADMCKVSQYPKLMCPNTDEGISKLINDSTGIAKETFLENSKKVKAKVQQEK